jgi:hypothetical protein
MRRGAERSSQQRRSLRWPLAYGLVLIKSSSNCTAINQRGKHRPDTCRHRSAGASRKSGRLRRGPGDACLRLFFAALGDRGALLVILYRCTRFRTCQSRVYCVFRQIFSSKECAGLPQNENRLHSKKTNRFSTCLLEVRRGGGVAGWKSSQRSRRDASSRS